MNRALLHLASQRLRIGLLALWLSIWIAVTVVVGTTHLPQQTEYITYTTYTASAAVITQTDFVACESLSTNADTVYRLLQDLDVLSAESKEIANKNGTDSFYYREQGCNEPRELTRQRFVL